MSKEQVKDFFIQGSPDSVKSVISMLQLEDLDEIVLKVQTHLELSSSSVLTPSTSDVTPLLTMTEIFQSIQDIRKEADAQTSDIRTVKSAVKDLSKQP